MGATVPTYGNIKVVAASPNPTCFDGMTWPPCRCAHCVVYYTGRRLASQYGRDRAIAILAGEDAAANADLAAWNRLGAS